MIRVKWINRNFKVRSVDFDGLYVGIYECMLEVCF